MTLPPVRRIVTGHDAAGRAVVVADTLVEGQATPTGVSVQNLLWTTPRAPVDNDDAADGREREVGLTLPGGSVLRMVDLMPGRSSPLHRTSSLDYGVVVSGEIELVLDDGSTTRLQPGAVVIQRGTMHAWRNPSPDTPARVAFVLLDARPATSNGAPLPDVHPSVGARID